MPPRPCCQYLALRSVAHEPLRDPFGWNVAVRAGESVMSIPQRRDRHHTHTGNVPSHHRHVSARNSQRLMLHYAPGG